MSMIIQVLLGLLTAGAPVQPAGADSTAVYSAILREIRAERPSSPVVLATARSAVECMPLCGAFSEEGAARPDETTHSPALLDALRDAGLVDAVCVVPRGTFGCSGPPGRVFVAMGPLTDDTPEGGARQEGAVWVKVAVSRAGPNGGNSYGYRVLVAREGCGWRVIRRRPEFFI
ncbi:MAG TPA: hypothetical protein VEY93_03020 [Longimicrobium sp.]|nr:hypothetical protein [Longimicrobium sp.]